MRGISSFSSEVEDVVYEMGSPPELVLALSPLAYHFYSGIARESQRDRPDVGGASGRGKGHIGLAKGRVDPAKGRVDPANSHIVSVPLIWTVRWVFSVFQPEICTVGWATFRLHRWIALIKI